MASPVSSPPSASSPPPIISDDETARLLEKEVSMTSEERLKRDEIRSQVIGEIVSTERSYYATLDLLTVCFVRPLKARMSSNKPFSDVSATQIEALCLNIETLHNFHLTLLAELEKVNPKQSEDDARTHTTISSVFIRYADLFKLYIPYLNGYEKMLETLNELRGHRKFQDFMSNEVMASIAAHTAKSGANTLDFLSYCIQPVQRVPRYVLLLSELKRRTSPMHPEWPLMLSALAKLQSVALQVNEGQRSIENMQKLLQIQQKIAGEFDSLVQPHRRLIREGLVANLTYASGMFSTLRTKKMYFILFSDILLWTSPEFKYKGRLDLTACKLKPKSSTSFSIESAAAGITAQFETEEETKSWFEEIDRVVCDLQNERDRLRSRRVAKARGLGATVDKDAVHRLVTENLAKLAVAASQNAATDGETSSTSDGTVGRSVTFASNTSYSAAPSMTIGKGTTLGHRSGRKFEEALESTEARMKRDQEHNAAHARAKIAADTFSSPDETYPASTSASPPASAASTAASPPATHTPPVIDAGRKFVPRFVNRRGKGTLKGACLCTTILLHRECPVHGEAAQQAAAEQASAEGQAAPEGQ